MKLESDNTMNNNGKIVAGTNNEIEAGQGYVEITSGTTIGNIGSITANNGSVTLSGSSINNGIVTTTSGSETNKNASISASEDVTITSSDPNATIANYGTITAGEKVSMDASWGANGGRGTINNLGTVKATNTDGEIELKSSYLVNLLACTDLDANKVTLNAQSWSTIIGGTIKAGTLQSIGGELHIGNLAVDVLKYLKDTLGVNLSDSTTVKINATTVQVGNAMNISGGSKSFTYYNDATGQTETINTNITTQINATNINAGGNLSIAGGTVGATTVESGNVLSITGGTISSTESLTITGKGNVTISGTSISVGATDGSDLSITSLNGSLTNSVALTANAGSVNLNSWYQIDNSATITAGKNVSMTSTKNHVNTSGSIQAGTASEAGTGIVSLNAGEYNPIVNIEGGTINASKITATANQLNVNDGNITVTTLEANNAMNIYGGNVDATDVKAGGNLDINGGTVKAVTISADGDVKITSGTISSRENNSALSISGANISFGGASVTAGSATINAASKISLQSGSLTATNALLKVTNGSADGDSIVESESGFTLNVSGNLDLSADKGNITLTGDKNCLAGVRVNNDAGDVTIWNTNSANTNALTVSTMVPNGSGKVNGSISIINCADGDESPNNNIMITDNLVATGGINIVNKEADILVEGGKVNAAAASFDAAQDFFLQAFGTINADEVEVTAGNDVTLAMATLVASKSASLTASKGVISQKPSESLEIVTPQLSVSAANGIRLGNKYNQLENVIVDSKNNGATIRCGNDEAKDLNVSGTVVGPFDIANESRGEAGAIVIDKSLSAEGSIVITNQNGNINVKDSAEMTADSIKLQAYNGDVNITSSSDVNIAKLIAGGTATASSQNGSVNIGSLKGNDVALSSGSGSSINVDEIIVNSSLQLQGDSIAVGNIDRSSNTGTLRIAVNGAGGENSCVQDDLELNLAGDVLFTNLYVNNANIGTSGNLDVTKLHVEGIAALTSHNTVANIYRQGLIFDPKDPNPIRDVGDGNDSWLKLTMNEQGFHYVVVQRAGGPDELVQQLSGKLVDYNPYDTYVEHYGDVIDSFGRYYLIEAPEHFVGQIFFSDQGRRKVLKRDVNGLRIEEEQG